VGGEPTLSAAKQPASLNETARLEPGGFTFEQGKGECGSGNGRSEIDRMSRGEEKTRWGGYRRRWVGQAWGWRIGYTCQAEQRRYFVFALLSMTLFNIYHM
jgi:hypothetical protein